MWIPIISKTERKDGRLFVDISITDGTSTVERRQQFVEGSIEDVKRWIRLEVKKLNDIEAISIEAGPIDTTPAPIPGYVPTAREVYSEKVRKLQAATRAVALGVLPNDNPAIVALRAEVAADISWPYADLF